MIRKSLRHPSFWLLLLGATIVLSSCGSSAVSERGSTKQPVLNPTPTPTATATVDVSGIPAQKFSFEVYGDSPSIVSQELTTDNLLEVKVTAATGGKNLGTNQPTNFQAKYNCATFKVILEIDQGAGWVQMAQQTTSPLKVAGTAGCDNSVDSQTINFSSYLFPGSKRARVKVQAMESDFYCLIYKQCLAQYQTYGTLPSNSSCVTVLGQGTNERYYCPLKSIYQYHTVDGVLQMQVNGTVLTND